MALLHVSQLSALLWLFLAGGLLVFGALLGGSQKVTLDTLALSHFYRP